MSDCIYIAFDETWLMQRSIALEVNTLFLIQKMCMKYGAIISYFYTSECEFLNMTKFRTASNVLDKTITGLETKKQNGRGGILSTGSYPPHLCAPPNPGPRFPTSYVFFMFDELKWEVVVCFVYIDGIGDHHSLSFFLRGII